MHNPPCLARLPVCGEDTRHVRYCHSPCATRSTTRRQVQPSSALQHRVHTGRHADPNRTKPVRPGDGLTPPSSTANLPADDSRCTCAAAGHLHRDTARAGRASACEGPPRALHQRLNKRRGRKRAGELAKLQLGLGRAGSGSTKQEPARSSHQCLGSSTEKVSWLAPVRARR